MRIEQEAGPGDAALSALREQIEQLDASLITLIARRVQLARRAGQLKSAAGLPTLDPAREAAVVRRAAALGRGQGLDEEEVRALYWTLVGLSRRAQEE